MSDTGPSELAKLVRDEEAFRLYVVSKLATIIANQDAHEREDARRFDEGNDRMDAIESKAARVSSSVATGERQFSKIDGMKIGVGAATAFFLAVGGAIWAVFTYFSGKQP